jgi:hypothetical protein
VGRSFQGAVPPAHKMLPVNGRRDDLPRAVFGTPRDPSGFLDIYRDPWSFIEIYRDPSGFIEIYGDEVPTPFRPRCGREGGGGGFSPTGCLKKQR